MPKSKSLFLTQDWQKDSPSLAPLEPCAKIILLWSVNFFLSNIKVVTARSKHLFIKITVDIFFTGRLSTLGWNHPSQLGKEKKKALHLHGFSPSLHLTLFMFKWVEIHLFLQRSSRLQHALCLNKPPASEAFFRLSVSPSPSPWAPIDVSSHFYVWHLKKQLKRIAPICKRKATFLKDKTGFSLEGIQTPWKMVFATCFGKVDWVHVCVCVAIFACIMYISEHVSIFASCVMFNSALP